MNDKSLVLSFIVVSIVHAVSGEEIGCNSLVKSSGDAWQYTFQVTSPQYWLFFESNRSALSYPYDYWQSITLSKFDAASNEYVPILTVPANHTETEHTDAERIKILQPNVTAGSYQISNSFRSDLASYELFMGCFDDDGVSPSYSYPVSQAQAGDFMLEYRSFVVQQYKQYLMGSISCGTTIVEQLDYVESVHPGIYVWYNHFYSFTAPEHVGVAQSDWVVLDMCDQTEFVANLYVHLFDGRLLFAYNYNVNRTKCISLNMTHVRSGRYWLQIMRYPPTTFGHVENSTYSLRMQCSYREQKESLLWLQITIAVIVVCILLLCMFCVACKCIRRRQRKGQQQKDAQQIAPELHGQHDIVTVGQDTAGMELEGTTTAPDPEEVEGERAKAQEGVVTNL